MIGEAAIGIQVAAAVGIGTQGLQNLIGIETACAVAGVHNDAETFQRLLLTSGGTDLISQDSGICIHKGAVFQGACAHTGDFLTFGVGQDLFDVALLQAALGGEELEAVAVERQMACSDHHGAVKQKTFGDSGHKHSGGAGHAEIGNQQALLNHCIADPAAKSLAGQTGISAHGDTDAGGLAGLILEPQSEASANVTADLLGEVHVLALDALQGYAANIAAVLQFLIIHRYILLGVIFSGYFLPNIISFFGKIINGFIG